MLDTPTNRAFITLSILNVLCTAFAVNLDSWMVYTLFVIVFSVSLKSAEKWIRSVIYGPDRPPDLWFCCFIVCTPCYDESIIWEIFIKECILAGFCVFIYSYHKLMFLADRFMARQIGCPGH